MRDTLVQVAVMVGRHSHVTGGEAVGDEGRSVCLRRQDRDGEHSGREEGIEDRHCCTSDGAIKDLAVSLGLFRRRGRGLYRRKSEDRVLRCLETSVDAISERESAEKRAKSWGSSSVKNNAVARLGALLGSR